jgi:lipopolysaccharide transport system permease protein
MNDAEATALPITVLEPKRRWWTIDWRELWHFRDLAWVLAMRDIQVRYKQSVLGALWAVLQPVLTMLVLSLFFGSFIGLEDRVRESGSDLPYPIFLYSGLLPWTFFAASVSLASLSLVSNAFILRKLYVPKLLIPVAATGAPALDFLVASSILVIMMIWYGTPISINVLIVPLFLLTMYLTAIGVGYLMSALTVEYRDFRYVIPFGIQIWFYASPVIYPLTVVPEQYRWILALNPMTASIEGFRSTVTGTPLDIRSLSISLLMAAFIFVIGLLYFSRVERRFADIA